MSQVSEQLIVHQLLSELNALHCMKLSEKPELKLSRLIFVGASHAGKMATLLGSSDQVLYLSLPAQTAPKAILDAIVNKLKSLTLSKQDAIIVDIFSSTVLMGSDEMGMPVPAFQTEPGRYHISGCLEIAPEGVLKKRFGAVRPVLEAAGEAVRCAYCRSRDS